MIHLNIYSPVEEIKHPLFDGKQVKVFVKRDDLIHPFISGNKWRKLKYILLKAKAENKNHLVTFGGAFSNHLVATACAAAKFGFKSTGIVRGENVQNEVLLFCRLFGMELQFVDRIPYRNKEQLFKEKFSGDDQAFFINEGGAGPEGIKGCAELMDEFDDTYDHIICAAGTGTTAAGILNGIKKQGLNTQLHVIPVLKNAGFIENEITRNIAEPANLKLHLNYHFGGYAKTDPELFRFMQSFASATGILTDPVYTGKLFYALVDLITTNYFKPHSKMLTIHTGGLLGITGMKDKISPIVF